MRAGLILFALALAGTLHADSAVMFEFPDGRSVALTSSGEISMVAESVTITPADELENFGEYLQEWHPAMNVRCVFYLVNESDRPVDITVGFPIDAKFGDSYTVFPDSMLVAMYDSLHMDEERSDWYDSGLSDGDEAGQEIPEELCFTASVDGEPLGVSYRTCSYDLHEEMIHKPVVAVWMMHFEPHQTVELVNTYNTSWDYYGGGPYGDFTVRYVLTTGSTWNGPIGEAVITLEVPDRFPRPQLSDTLLACWDWSGSPVISGRTVRWKFDSFEPDENLEFTIRTVDTEANGYYLSPSHYVEEVPRVAGDVLFTAGRMMSDELAWGQWYNRGLVLRLLEAAPYMAKHMIPPDASLTTFFNTSCSAAPGEFNSEDLAVIEMIEGLRSDYEQDLDLVSDAGYSSFLPLFTVKYWWDEEDIDMYAAQPGLEEKYLTLLLNLETAMNGGIPEDPAVEAFYRLTGWYNPGDSLWNIPALTDSVEVYRESL